MSLPFFPLWMLVIFPLFHPTTGATNSNTFTGNGQYMAPANSGTGTSNALVGRVSGITLNTAARQSYGSNGLSMTAGTSIGPVPSGTDRIGSSSRGRGSNRPLTIRSEIQRLNIKRFNNGPLVFKDIMLKFTMPVITWPFDTDQPSTKIMHWGIADAEITAICEFRGNSARINAKSATDKMFNGEIILQTKEKYNQQVVESITECKLSGLESQSALSWETTVDPVLPDFTNVLEPYLVSDLVKHLICDALKAIILQYKNVPEFMDKIVQLKQSGMLYNDE